MIIFLTQCTASSLACMPLAVINSVNFHDDENRAEGKLCKEAKKQ